MTTSPDEAARIASEKAGEAFDKLMHSDPVSSMLVSIANAPITGIPPRQVAQWLGELATILFREGFSCGSECAFDRARERFTEFVEDIPVIVIEERGVGGEWPEWPEPSEN